MKGPNANHTPAGATSPAVGASRTDQAKAAHRTRTASQGSGPSRHTRSSWPSARWTIAEAASPAASPAGTIVRGDVSAQPYRKTRPNETPALAT